jgi:hypothetical protein
LVGKGPLDDEQRLEKHARVPDGHQGRVLVGLMSGQAIVQAIENGTLDELCEAWANELNVRIAEVEAASGQQPEVARNGDGAGQP